MTALPRAVRIVEVGPRDGLQNEATVLPSADRVDLISALADCGLGTVEAGSFVNPARIPQMADTAEVLAGLDLDDGRHYPVLVPNPRGLADALAAGVREIAVFGAASETFSQKNINCSIADSLARFEAVTEQARAAGLRIRGYISCVLGCPYEGDIDPGVVVDVARRLEAMGCYEISAGDTIGTGTAERARDLVRRLQDALGSANVAVHFHDTYGQALANIYAALLEGVDTVDSSVAGLGGCPYARGASGNVASEDVVYLLNGLGVEHGVDLERLVQVGEDICARLGRPAVSRVNLALGGRRQSATG